MKVKAKVSFSGPAVSMSVGQVGEIADKALLADLLRAGYVEEIETKTETKTEEKPPKKKAVKSGEGK